MCAAVIASCDAPPVFKFAKHILDLMALFVENFVVFDLYFSIFLRRNTGLDAFVLQDLPEPIRIITAIRQKLFGRWQIIDNQTRAFIVTHLSFR